MFDVLADLFIEIIPEFTFKLIKTILRLIGSGFRYLIFLGKQNYQDILNKPYNGRIGFVIVLIFLTLTLFLKFNIKD